MKKQTSIILAALVATTLHAAAQGSLTPPPGVPSPIMKTLDEVEARKAVNALPGDASATHIIALPGSYYLTGPVTGNTGKVGIRIEATNVTLDLNGCRRLSKSGFNCLSKSGQVSLINMAA